MRRSFGPIFVMILILAAVLGSPAQRQRGGPAETPVAMDSASKTFDTSDYRIRVVTIADGLVYPYCLTFLPDGTILFTELNGRLRMIRDGRLLPEPISGTPDVYYVPGRGGLMDIAAHPDFAENHLIYFTYDKPGERGATQAVARGRLQDTVLTGVEDVFVAEAWGEARGHLSARIAFGRDGMLYVAIADHNLREEVAKGTSHAGKVVRLNADGTAPASGPFGAAYRPEIYATGFRDPHALVLDPVTGDFWEVEHGDEINVVKEGANYGWPYVSSGEGEPIGPPPERVIMTEPYVKDRPVFHFGGLTFYTGNKFPKWKGNIFVGCLTTQEVHRVVPGTAGAILRESLFTNLGQEVRDVRQGPDGFIYFTTNDGSGRLMRIEPAD